MRLPKATGGLAAKAVDRPYARTAHRIQKSPHGYSDICPEGQVETPPSSVKMRLEEEKDTSIRRALLLSLGEYGLDRLPLVERQNLLPRLLALYRNDPDPGIHGAVRWLLKQWRAQGRGEERGEGRPGAATRGE